MGSLLNRILSLLGRAAADAATDLLRDELGKRSGGTRTTSSPTGQGSAPRPRATSTGTTTGHTTPRPGTTSHATTSGATAVYDVAAHGLPAFSYSPSPDGDADPGEVVWTWVPYEEDATQGKDRPVLVLARHGSGASTRLVVAQLTSKDHDADAAQEARHGRYWHDVGAGAWDAQRRPSEMRLDRLLLVAPSAVRREGATMDRATFDSATEALRRHWS